MGEVLACARDDTTCALPLALPPQVARTIIGQEKLRNGASRQPAAISSMRRETEGKGNQAHAKNRKSDRDTFGVAEKLGGSVAKRGRGSVQDTAQYSLRLYKGIQRQCGWKEDHKLPR